MTKKIPAVRRLARLRRFLPLRFRRLRASRAEPYIVVLTTAEEADVTYGPPEDADGEPAPVQPGTLVWQTSNPLVAIVEPVSEDPIMGTIVATGIGTCAVWPELDADLSEDGITTIEGARVPVQVLAVVDPGEAVEIGEPIVSPPREQDDAVPVPPGGKLVRPADLVWLGAFRLPLGLGYAGIGLAFDEAAHAVYLGDTVTNYIAKVGAIEPVASSDLAQLPRAPLIHGLTDACCGLLAQIVGDAGTVPSLGGMLIWDGKLIVSAYRFYDANANGMLSHIVCNMDLAAPSAHGPYQVGAYGAGSVGGYMGFVPDAWRAALGAPVLSGLCGISIVTRTSAGNAAFAIDPAQIGVTQPYAPSNPLAYYPDPDGPLLYVYENPVANPLYSRCTRVRGLVVCPGGSASLLFFGDHGLGPNCYGTGQDCGDTANTAKGDHQPPYVPQVWAYDAHDLAAVHAGKKEYATLEPYAYWQLAWPYPAWGQVTSLGGAIDPASGRIYVAQARAGSDESVIHVYTIAH